MHGVDPTLPRDGTDLLPTASRGGCRLRPKPHCVLRVVAVRTGLSICGPPYPSITADGTDWSSKQLLHILCGTSEHGAIAAFDDWTLQQVRMFDH